MTRWECGCGALRDIPPWTSLPWTSPPPPANPHIPKCILWNGELGVMSWGRLAGGDVQGDLSGEGDELEPVWEYINNTVKGGCGKPLVDVETSYRWG